MPYKTLADIPEGQSACVESLQVQGSLRSRLSDLGLIPGTPVVCVHSGKGIAAYLFNGSRQLDTIQGGAFTERSTADSGASCRNDD